MWEPEGDNHKARKYISKNNIEFARLLARKMYLKRLIRDKENELKCVNYYVKHRKDPRHLELLAPDSPYSSLLQNEELADWEYADYPKSKSHPEHLIHKAPKNELVRSKSEATIAQILFDNHIPYRYENIHIIDGESIATDFTVMHPVTHKIILWEHLGKTDDPAYQPTIIYKIKHYLAAGFLPGRDLILTFEDSKTPMNYLDILEVVRKHFT